MCWKFQYLVKKAETNETSKLKSLERFHCGKNVEKGGPFNLLKRISVIKIEEKG